MESLKVLVIYAEKKPSPYYGPSNLTKSIGRLLQKDMDLSVEYITLPVYGNPHNRWEYILFYFLSFSSIVLKLPKIIKRIKNSDIVHLHYLRTFDYIFLSIITRILKKHVIITLYFRSSPILLRILQITNIKIHVWSPYLYKYILSHIKRRIFFSYPYINVKYFEPINKTKEIKIRYKLPLRDSFIIGYHGRPSYLRGTLLVIDVINVLKNRKDIKNIYGLLSIANVKEETSIKNIKEKISSLKLTSSILLTIGRNVPKEIYNICDIIILAPVSPFATMSPPLSVLEAMACGAIVVSSSFQELGLYHIITNNKNGIIVEPTVDKVSMNILNLYEFPKLRKKIKYHARKTILRSNVRTIKVLSKLYWGDKQ